MRVRIRPSWRIKEAYAGSSTSTPSLARESTFRSRPASSFPADLLVHSRSVASAPSRNFTAPSIPGQWRRTGNAPLPPLRRGGGSTAGGRSRSPSAQIPSPPSSI
jgi:hypothetical protein